MFLVFRFYDIQLICISINKKTNRKPLHNEIIDNDMLKKVKYYIKRKYFNGSYRIHFKYILFCSTTFMDTVRISLLVFAFKVLSVNIYFHMLKLVLWKKDGNCVYSIFKTINDDLHFMEQPVWFYKVEYSKPFWSIN